MNRVSVISLALLSSIFIAVTIYYGFIFDDRSFAKAQWKNRAIALGQLDSRLQQLVDEIQSFQGESKCDSNDQCRVIGLGSKACGYYKNFLIYSTKDADEQSLLKLIAEFNRAHEKLVDLTLTIDKCGKKPASIHCFQQRCMPQSN